MRKKTFKSQSIQESRKKIEKAGETEIQNKMA